MTLAIPLPARMELEAIFDRLRIQERDRDEILEGWPAPGDAETARRLADAYEIVARDMGGYGPLEVPSPPSGSSATARYFYVYVFLALLPVVRAYHREHDVPDEISWSTLADLGRNLARDHVLFGVGGLRTSGWLTLHFRGAIYELGRLQYNRMTIRAAHVANEFREGEHAVGIHIPESGRRLTSEACDASLVQAGTFFARHFPETPTRLALCTSWLLDPQLAEYLGPESNIVRFQRRFRLVGDGYEGDADVLRFVFHRIAPEIDGLPQRTTLERAIVMHLRAGGHWRNRTGWVIL